MRRSSFPMKTFLPSYFSAAFPTDSSLPARLLSQKEFLLASARTESERESPSPFTQRPASNTPKSIDRDPRVGLPVDGEELFILCEHLEQADLAGRAWPDAMGAGGVAEREAGSGATERRRGARGGGAPFSVE